MKNLIALLCAFCLSVAAHAAAPSADSIEKLLKLVQAEKMLDSVRPQIDGMMKTAMANASQGKVLSPAEQKIIDAFRTKAVAITMDELTMAKLKPMYVEIYSTNFTQQEIDGLIAFYESPTGKAFVTKMPLVMQSIMADMPKRLNPMLQKMEQAQKEMKEQLEALKKKEGK